MSTVSKRGLKLLKPKKIGRSVTDKHGRKMTPQASNDMPVDRFIRNVDRELLEYILSQDEKYSLFLRALHDPIQSHLSFSGLMRRFNVSLHELQTVYTDAQRHMGLIQMSNRLPQVMEDISIDALSKTVSCSRCDGLGTIPIGKTGTRTCPQCDGEGKVHAPGSTDARQQMLETMKLVGKSSTNFIVQQNFGAGDLESEMALTQKIVMGDRAGS